MEKTRCRLFDVAAAVAAIAVLELDLTPLILTSRACVARGLPPIATLKPDAFRGANCGANNEFPGAARLASAECE
jgi:hypothetical protein